MPISSSDIKIRLSTKSGSAGNSLSQGNVNNSLGKYISTTDIVNSTLNNLFDDISGSENAASTVDYRCVFVYNAHPTLTWTGVKIYLSAEGVGGANISIAIDDIVASVVGDTSAQAAEIANETTAPTGVGSFSAPTTTGAALSIGDLPAGKCRAVWVKRTATNSAAVDSDSVDLTCFGDTSA